MDGVFDFVLGVYGRARAVIGEGLDQLWTSFNYGSIFDELGPIRSTIEEMSRSGRRKRLVLRIDGSFWGWSSRPRRRRVIAVLKQIR